LEDALLEPILTKRLLLREPAASDAETIVRYVNNYEVAKQTARIPFPYGLQDAEDFLSWADEDNASGASAIFAIALKSAPDALTGVVSVERYEDSAELGYWLAEPFWGQGIMREASLEVAAYSFVSFGVDRLAASYFLGNERSKRILVGLGFTATGQSMAHSRAQGRDVAMENMEMTKNRFAELQRKRGG
jgi:[ribosomal protein S5]-alanine N-acetyltransferase